jgi:hypothetical protein
MIMQLDGVSSFLGCKGVSFITKLRLDTRIKPMTTYLHSISHLGGSSDSEVAGYVFDAFELKIMDSDESPDSGDGFSNEVWFPLGTSISLGTML